MISRISIWVGSSVAAALALAVPASAALPIAFSEHDRADINCLIVVSAVLGEAESDTSSTDKANLRNALSYFVGKLKGRHPTLSMAELLTLNLYKKLAPELPAEIQRCELETIRMGEDLQAAGKNLMAAGK